MWLSSVIGQVSSRAGWLAAQVQAWPGVRGPYRMVRDLAREWRADRLGGLAAEVAFFWLLSLFPALLAVAAALGSLEVVVGDDLASQAEEEVVGFLQQVLTEDAAGTVAAVRDLFEESDAGTLTLGAVAALWAVSRGFTALVVALHAVYDLGEPRGYLARRAVALALAVGSVVVATAMLAGLVLGPLLGTGRDVADAVGLGGAFATMWDWLRWPAAVVVLVAWAATVLHVSAGHGTRWRRDLPGAVLAGAAWAALSGGLRGYLAVAPGANQVLGTLGGTLIVLLWLYLLALGLLLGGELNALLAARRKADQLGGRESAVGRDGVGDDAAVAGAGAGDEPG